MEGVERVDQRRDGWCDVAAESWGGLGGRVPWQESEERAAEAAGVEAGARGIRESQVNVISGPMQLPLLSRLEGQKCS